VRVAGPVVAGQLAITRSPCLKEEGMRSVECREAEQPVLIGAFEVTIVPGWGEKSAGDARRSRILVEFSARRRNALGVDKLRFPDAADVGRGGFRSRDGSEARLLSARSPKRQTRSAGGYRPRPLAPHRVAVIREISVDCGVVPVEANRDART